MRKSVKKFLAVTATALMAVSAVSLAACNANFKKPTGIPSGEVTSNGGFVVSVGDASNGYYYFINGVETYTADNTYGAPVKGSLMRVLKSDVAKKENNAETVIPSLMVAGDYTAGLFIYGGRVYYATPTNERDKYGDVENSLLEFRSANLDGSDITVIKDGKDVVRLTSNTSIYRFVEVGDTVYLLYVEGTSTYTMHSVNTKTNVDTVLFKGATDYKLDGADKENPVIYYTMNVVDRMDTDGGSQQMLYNQVYRVSADATEAPYTYTWDEEWLKENDNTAPYTNLGALVFDGIGSNDKKTQFNQSESEPLSPIGYSYKLRAYKNGGLYFVRTQTNGVGGDLYYVAESDLTAAAWDSVSGNTTESGSKLTKVANAIDASSKATERAFFYTEGEGATLTHHYLYVSGASMFRVDVGENGTAETDLEIAYDIGSATVLGLDNTSDTEYSYVYFTRSASSGLTVERAVYNGEEENYKNLTFNGQNNEAYEPVKVLDIQHVGSWYPCEIIDNTVFYADAETFGGTAYSYVSCVSLTNAEGKLMNNVEIKAFNDLYESIANNSDKTVGLFAKLNDAFGDSDLSNAFRYFFYTGETAQFDANIKYATDNGQKETSLYTLEEQEAFAKFAAGEGYTFSANNQEKELFAAETRKDVKGNSIRTYDYFRLKLGERTAEDEESFAKYWKTSGLKSYTPPVVEKEPLPWWAWLLISIGIAEGVAIIFCAGMAGYVGYVIGKKKGAQKAERLEVVTADDKNIDVYADETPAEESAEEAPAAEEVPAEEPAEEVPAEEAPVEEAPAENPEE